MKKKKKNFMIFFIVFIVVLVSLFVYLYISTDGQIFSKVLNNIVSDEDGDNYNGIYTFEEDLNGSKTIFSGCITSKINHHILIVNDTYYTYRSSCIGTFFFEQGKVKSLDIRLNESDKSYYINYNERKYLKDNVTKSLVLNNAASNKMKKINVMTYALLLKESQFKGSYYELKNVSINGLAGGTDLSFSTKFEDGKFKIKISSSFEDIYSYSYSNYEDAPELYPYGSYIIAINKDELTDRYANKFVAISEDGITYDLDKKFPIVVNGVSLNTDMSTHVSFNKEKRNFRIIISKDKKLCDEKSKNHDIAYYEFSVDYDYSLKTFTNPKFEKIGFLGEDCDYINSVIRREI